MTGPTITALRTRRITVPLTRPWGDDVRDVGVVAVEVTASDGVVGHGFSWTPSRARSAVAALLADDLTDFALGRPAEPDLWQSAWEHLHEAGGGGVTTIALAGLDLALWDLRARRAGVGLAGLLGRTRESVPAYGSGVNLHYTLEELVAQVRRWVDTGYGAVKIKVGKPDAAEDLDRVAAVREILGSDRGLMLDANQRWDLPTAVERAAGLARFDPLWLEEPLRADDLAAHVTLKREIGIPIAVGENLHTIHRFRDMLDAGVADVVQPNIVRVGGITPFLAIARLARERGAQLAPHLLPELSAQVAMTLPEEVWVEDVEDAGFAALGALTAPTGLAVTEGSFSGGPHVGLGIRFKGA